MTNIVTNAFQKNRLKKAPKLIANKEGCTKIYNRISIKYSFSLPKPSISDQSIFIWSLNLDKFSLAEKMFKKMG